MGVEVKLDTAGLDALLASWDHDAEQLVVKVATDVLNTAVENAPKKTGYMASTGHIEPGDDKFSRYVIFSATYSIYVHEGTRFMVGRPYLRQSMETHRNSFQQDISELFGSFVEK